MKLSLFDIKLHTMSLISILILYINLLFVTILKLFFFTTCIMQGGKRQLLLFEM